MWGLREEISKASTCSALGYSSALCVVVNFLFVKAAKSSCFFLSLPSEALRLIYTSTVPYVASHSIREFIVSPSYYSRALNVACVSYLTQTKPNVI